MNGFRSYEKEAFHLFQKVIWESILAAFFMRAENNLGEKKSIFFENRKSNFFNG